jgi:hypothetical protein
MLIRTRCCNPPQDRQRTIEGNGADRLSTKNPKACYTDRKSKRRILCGSV